MLLIVSVYQKLIVVYTKIRTEITMSTFNHPLVVAARTGNSDALTQLLSTERFALSTYALEVAAENGHANCVDILIPFSEPDQNDSRPLERAAEKGHTQCVERLIPVSDMTHCKALERAAMHGHTQCVRLLKDVSNLYENRHALYWGAITNNLEIVTLLLTVMDAKWGESLALTSAAAKGHTRIVEALLPHSDANAKNAEAMLCALQTDNSACVDLLYPYTDIPAFLSTLHGLSPRFEKMLNEAEYKWTAQNQNSVLHDVTEEVAQHKPTVARKL